MFDAPRKANYVAAGGEDCGPMVYLRVNKHRLETSDELVGLKRTRMVGYVNGVSLRAVGEVERRGSEGRDVKWVAGNVELLKSCHVLLHQTDMEPQQGK